MKVIFLDRDGVINKYPGDESYVLSRREFRFLPGSIKALKLLTEAGFKIYVVSNQAGVSKGLYSRDELDKITELMKSTARRKGGRIEKVLYCLHTSDDNCSCRKPKAGLLEQAVRGKKIDLSNTYFIGDSIRDVLAGKCFGCKTILVLSGREKLKNAQKWETLPDFIANDLLDAARHILGGKYERA